MRAIHVVGFALPVLAAGCAWQPKPTPQLVQAQQAYADAASGPAAQKAPRELREARESLQRAIRADRAGDTDRVKFAELARSRALLANQQAYTGLARQQRDLAHQQLAQAQQIRQKLIGQAQQQRQELQQREAQLRQMQQQLQQQAQEQQLREQQLRQQQPEGRTLMQPPVALMRLADQRRAVPAGTQLVFSSGMQFENKQATLTPEAEQKLDQIAEALQSIPNAAVVVDGFSDSMGSPALDQRLSTARADAVADYLGSHGVPRSSIETRGLGSSRPPAESTTGGAGAQPGGAQVLVTVPRTGATEMQPSGPSGGQPGMQQPSGGPPTSPSGVEQAPSPGSQPPSGTQNPPGNDDQDGP